MPVKMKILMRNLWMQSENGSTTVPVALFGVSPNSWCGRFRSPFGAPGPVLSARRRDTDGSGRDDRAPHQSTASFLPGAGSIKSKAPSSRHPPKFIGLSLFLILAVLPVATFAQRTGGPPVINQQPQSQFVEAGTAVTFQVGVAQSYTPVRY